MLMKIDNAPILYIYIYVHIHFCLSYSLSLFRFKVMFYKFIAMIFTRHPVAHTKATVPREKLLAFGGGVILTKQIHTVDGRNPAPVDT